MTYQGIHRKPGHTAQFVMLAVFLTIWTIATSYTMVANGIYTPYDALFAALPNCPTDDGSGGSVICAWNGQTDGNGQGGSFVVIKDNLVKLPK